MSFEHYSHDEDREINLHEQDGLLSVRCDEVVDGMRCDNYIDLALNPMSADLDALFWNSDEAKGARMLGWTVTDAHEYCPQHGTRSLRKEDANQAAVGTSNR
jgi:hypothetical protein